ncbi:hypothetical protein BGP_4881 [Beggiatoa sp. PS]|nr:hypothetical protein BGP_4881 [Beggiatoa sp. PS]
MFFYEVAALFRFYFDDIEMMILFSVFVVKGIPEFVRYRFPPNRLIRVNNNAPNWLFFSTTKHNMNIHVHALKYPLFHFDVRSG